MLTTVTLELDGHLDRARLEAELATLPADGRLAVLFDCRGMSGYSLDARGAFVDWNRDNRERVAAVAITTPNLLWHVVVSAMALASGQPMRAFTDATEARAWLRRRAGVA